MSKFKMGDKVFCKLGGWGKVDTSELGHVRVNFLNSDRKNRSYFSDGKIYSEDLYPCLLTQDEAASLGHKPPIEKRKVTMWVNLYDNNHYDSGYAYPSKRKAQDNAGSGATHVAIPFTSDIEIEVPE